MKGLVIFATVITLAKATGFYPLNELGSLDYGINDGSISRQEIRTPDGIIRGSVTYIDGDGKHQTITYGGENDLPSLPKVAATEEQDDKSAEQSQDMKEEVTEEPMGEDKQEEATPSKSEAPATTDNLPQPVQYTPEVAAARAAHFVARDQAIYLQRLTNNQHQLLNQPIVHYPPIFRDYYGAAKHLQSTNPYYYL